MDDTAQTRTGTGSGDYQYDTAFARNLGWVTAAEQQRLRNARVAIAGLGGVGGAHLLTLARLGIGRFNIADFDRFELHNFNRQVGAFVSTIGQSKVSTLTRMALDINPELDIRCFDAGVDASNQAEFLGDADVYVDGLDFFAVEARRSVFAACAAKDIAALTAAPLGMGVSLLHFAPRGMSFEQYFQLEGRPREEQLARFVAGLSPAMLQRRYLAAPEALNFGEERGPSTAMACDLCAGVMGVEVLKVLLKRGRCRPAPWVLQFDAYEQRLRYSWRPFGNAHPLQRLLLSLIRPKLRGLG